MLAVFLAHDTLNQVVSHAESDLDNEVGGVLLGIWCVDPETSRQFILVKASLPARFTQQGNVFLTFTQDSLVDIHAKIDTEYPEYAIVGWYHTHPRMGVFLSHYDTWLHAHFFPEAWQVALVIEPHSALGGFFIRQLQGELDPSRYFGFYELQAETGHSQSTWNNLQLIPGNPGNIREEPNE